MDVALAVVRALSNAVYLALAIAATALYFKRRTPAALWVAVAFDVVAAVVVIGAIGTAYYDSDVLPMALTRIVILLLVAFPWALARFSDAFHPSTSPATRIADIGTAALAVMTLAIPEFAEPDAQLTMMQSIYLILFLGVWAYSFLLVAFRLSIGSRSLPTVPRRRAHLLAVGSILMAVLLVAPQATGGNEPDDASLLTLIYALMGVASGGLFLMAFAVPEWLRALWRRGEEVALQNAALELMLAKTPEQVTEILLPRAMALMGGTAARITNAEGVVLGHAGEELSDGRAVASITHAMHNGDLTVFTGPYAPFLGHGEEALTARLGLLADLALDRTKLLQEVEAKNTALVDVNAELESFLYSVSHDLKNPLTSLSGYLDLLATHHVETLTEETLFFIKRMRRNSAYMNELINDLLELSRVGRTQEDEEWVDIEPLIADISADLDLRSQEINVDIGPLPEILANRTRMEQVFTNLIDNAVKYAGRDDVHIDIRADANPEGGVRIRLSDNGRGVDPEYRERVFGVFERLDEIGSIEKGTGIGLAVVRKIIERLGGSIHMADPCEEFPGAHFVLDLPETRARWASAELEHERKHESCPSALAS